MQQRSLDLFYNQEVLDEFLLKHRDFRFSEIDSLKLKDGKFTYKVLNPIKKLLGFNYKLLMTFEIGNDKFEVIFNCIEDICIFQEIKE